MKRIILGLGAAAVLAVPATAGAAGGAECSSATHGATWKNPGAMFQAARDGYAVNPKQLADVHGMSVGKLVRAACGS